MGKDSKALGRKAVLSETGDGSPLPGLRGKRVTVERASVTSCSAKAFTGNSLDIVPLLKLKQIQQLIKMA